MSFKVLQNGYSSSTVAPRVLALRLNLAAALACISALSIVRGLPAQETVKLRIRNDTGYPAKVAVRSLQSRNSNWSEIDIASRRVRTLELVPPDDFKARGTVEGVTYESQAMPLKQWVKNDPAYELVVSEIFSGSNPTVPQIRLGLDFRPPPESSPHGAVQNIQFNRLGTGRPILDKIKKRLGR